MSKQNINLNSLHINAARELHQLTTKSRYPNKLINKDNRDIDNHDHDHNDHTHTHQLINLSNNSNPTCHHCGQIIIPSPVASLPIVDNPSISINNNWFICTQRKPILNFNEIENFENLLDNNISLPEMVFGNNKLEILYINPNNNNKEIKFHIMFNALDALKLVDKNPENLIKVSYANSWFNSKINSNNNNNNDNNNDNLKIHKPFDWTYTTFYKGSIIKNDFNWINDSNNNFKIPINKLSNNNPIKFFDDMILFEDELGDNGISILNIKIRVMSNCLLLLQRLFIRVDNVLIRLIETRLFIDFDENLIIREQKFLQDDYQNILNKINIKNSNTIDPKKFFRDINWCSKNLPILKTEREYMILD